MRVPGRSTSSCLTALLLTGALCSSADAALLAVGWSNTDSPVYLIDENTGSGSLLGLSGFGHLNSLAPDSNGTFYSVGGSADNTLITINPVTGAGAFVATLSSADFRGMAFSPANVLYAIRNGGPGGDELVTVNVNTGVVTLVGTTARSGVQALAFSPGGTLYGWDAGDGTGLGLITINPTTGASTDVGAANGTATQVQGLGFSPDGTLYGGVNSLYRINLTTGVLTLVGSGGYTDVRGIDYVPEPTALGMSVLAAAACLRRRRMSY